MSETNSATAWKHLYFLGVSPLSPDEIDLSADHIKALLSFINARAGISSRDAVDPRHLINSKGLTLWLAMCAFLATKYPKDLNDAQSGEGLHFLPKKFAHDFGSPFPWPPEVLAKYDLNMPMRKLFVIPFLVPRYQANPLREMDESLKAGDGSMEIFGFEEFNEEDPEKFLAKLAAFAAWYKQERSTKH